MSKIQQLYNEMMNSFKRVSPTTIFLFKWIYIGSILGIVIGSASALFLVSLEWATQLRENHLWIISLLPIGGLLIGLLYHYNGKEVEGGNNLIIDSIHQPKSIIPIKMAPMVLISTVLTHLIGGSAGREGTALQISAALSDQFSKIFKLIPSERSMLLIAAVAGGFGSVFGTPLAGAVFALEFYFIGKINYKALFPAFYTAIFADLITNLYPISHTHYNIGFIPDFNFIYFLYAIGAGIVFGICAATFSRSMKFFGNLFKSKISYPPFRPLIGGGMIALCILALGTTKYIGLGIPTIVAAFNHPLPQYDFAIKLFLTVLTLSAGFKGGEVTPLFFIGATLGNALGIFIPLPIGLLAGMGFVAVFAGATNTPLACILMAAEIFGVDGIVYVAIACVVSYLIAGHTSIYSAQRIGIAKNDNLLEQENKSLRDI